MRFVSFAHQGGTGAGVLVGEEVAVLPEAPDLGAYLRAGGSRRPDLAGLPRLRLEAVRLLAPVPRPPKIVAVGLNYRDHAEEQGKEPPLYPMFFAKAPSCVVGLDEPIRLPEGRKYIDPEVELAVVIGRGGRHVPRERALEHVFGFTIMNDVSDRKAQKDDRQYYRAKSFYTFGPLGPAVVTPDEFDHRQAGIRLRLNGCVQQESNTRHLIFGVEHLVELLSAFQELEPGDVISTGTPSGVGVFRDPPVYLQDGDLVECEIDGIGVLRNPVTPSSGPR